MPVIGPYGPRVSSPGYQLPIAFKGQPVAGLGRRKSFNSVQMPGQEPEPTLDRLEFQLRKEIAQEQLKQGRRGMDLKEAMQGNQLDLAREQMGLEMDKLNKQIEGRKDLQEGSEYGLIERQREAQAHQARLESDKADLTQVLASMDADKAEKMLKQEFGYRGAEAAQLHQQAIAMVAKKAAAEEALIGERTAGQRELLGDKIIGEAALINARGGLAEKERAWKSGEAALNRKWQGSESDKERSFRGKESDKALGTKAAIAAWEILDRGTEREWKSGEAALDRKWRTGEAKADRTWKTGEAKADRTWKTGERVGTQEFTSKEAQKNRRHEIEGPTRSEMYQKAASAEPEIAQISAKYNKIDQEIDRGKITYNKLRNEVENINNPFDPKVQKMQEIERLINGLSVERDMLGKQIQEKRSAAEQLYRMSER